MRLNQYVAKVLGVTRKQADEMIRQGLFQVDGCLAGLGYRLDGDELIQKKTDFGWEELVGLGSGVMLVYKPIFFVADFKDSLGRRCLKQLLPGLYQDWRVWNRLDYLSEGLLVLSLKQPEKVGMGEYIFSLSEALTEEQMSILRQGVYLGSDFLGNLALDVMTPDVVQQDFGYLKPELGHCWYKAVYAGRKNQQIRKMLRVVESKVLRLVGVRLGDLGLTPKLYHEKRIVLP